MTGLWAVTRPRVHSLGHLRVLSGEPLMQLQRATGNCPLLQICVYTQECSPVRARGNPQYLEGMRALTFSSGALLPAWPMVDVSAPATQTDRAGEHAVPKRVGVLSTRSFHIHLEKLKW